jgi:hypothetical protein
MWPFKRYRLGELKKLEKMRIRDFKDHPVWVCDLSGESTRGHDETSIRPLLDEVDVTPRFARRFVSVELLIRIPETDTWGTASYQDKDTLSTLGFWIENSWQTPSEAGLAENEVKIEAIASIGGQKSVRFVLRPGQHNATRV